MSVQQCSNSLVVQTGPKTRRSTRGTICACVHVLVCFHKILHMWTMLVQPADTVQTFSLRSLLQYLQLCVELMHGLHIQSPCAGTQGSCMHDTNPNICTVGLLSAAGVMPRKSSTEWGELDQHCCFSLHVGTILAHVFKGRCKVFKTQFRLFNV